VSSRLPGRSGRNSPPIGTLYFEEERKEIEEVLRPHASSGGSHHVRSNVLENNVAQGREEVVCDILNFEVRVVLTDCRLT
jgi:hypothetical protein